jgi:hypothetical protein
MFNATGYGQTSGDYRSKVTGNWNESTTWESYDGADWVNASSTPTSTNNVSILSGHTVNVPASTTVECSNLTVNSGETAGVQRLTFGDADSRLHIWGVLNATSTSPGTSVIDNSNGSRIVFKRTTDGSIFGENWGWGGFTTGTTKLRFEVDCGTATVTNSGTHVRAAEIIINNGTLSISGGNLQPNAGSSNTGVLTVNSGATLSTTTLLSRITTANTSFESFTIEGNGVFTTASTVTRVWPEVVTTNFSNSSTVEFRSISKQYIPAATYGNLTLSAGTTTPDKELVGDIIVSGLFSIRGSATFQKSTFSITYGNDAILQYGVSGQSTAQTTTDNEWPETDGPKHVRIWNTGGVTLHANRSIPLDGILTLSSGTFNLNGNTLTLGNNVTIRRNAGALSAAPNFSTSVNIEYGSTITSVTTSHEVPTTVDVLNDLTISSTQGVTLGSDMTVNGELSITGSNLMTTSNYGVYFGTSASNPSESSGKSIIGKAVMNESNIGTGGLDFLGVNLAAGVDDIGNVTLNRITGTDGRITVGENSGINCNWDITVGSQPLSGRDVTFSWLSDFDNGKNMEQATLWKKDGENWNRIIAATNVSGNNPRNFAATGITSFSQWTVADDSSPLPVELTSFTAKVNSQVVILNWQTATEINNYGFNVERNSIPSSDWETIGFVDGHGNSNSIKEYSFADRNTSAGDYSYRLKQIDIDGEYSYSNILNIKLDNMPTEFALYQNYPNPFNPSTRIDYSLKSDASVKVELYSIIGEKVSVLINENQTAGYYTFSVDAARMRLSSGVYLVRFSINDLIGYESYSKIIKMILNK